MINFKLRTNDLTPLLLSPLMLVACVGAPEGADTEDVAEVSSALASGTLPDSIDLNDDPGGDAARVSTPQGFYFILESSSSKASGTYRVTNRSQYPLSVVISLVTTCIRSNGGGDYNVPLNRSVTVAPGSLSQAGAACNFGDSVRTTGVSFDNLQSDAPDIGYTSFDENVKYAGLESTFRNNRSPNGTITIGPGLIFKDTKRSTWASGEIINRGSTSLTVNLLYTHVFCSGGGDFIKKWGPNTVKPGQSMTSTVSCPSGQTVDIAATTWH